MGGGTASSRPMPHPPGARSNPVAPLHPVRPAAVAAVGPDPSMLYSNAHPPITPLSAGTHSTRPICWAFWTPLCAGVCGAAWYCVVRCGAVCVCVCCVWGAHTQMTKHSPLNPPPAAPLAFFFRAIQVRAQFSPPAWCLRCHRVAWPLPGFYISSLRARRASVRLGTILLHRPHIPPLAP